MELVKDIWDAAPFWVPVVVLAAGAFAVLRFRRWRTGSAAKRGTNPFPLQTDAEMLDSSHIGYAPLGLGKKPPERPLESSTGHSGGDDKAR